MMADTIRFIQYFYVMAPNKPGEGARILNTLRDAGVNLLAFSAFPHARRAQLDLVPAVCLPKTSYARFAWSAGAGPGSARSQHEYRGRALLGKRRSGSVLQTVFGLPCRRARSSGAGCPWWSSGRVAMVAVVQPTCGIAMTSPGAAGSTARLTGGSLPNARCVRQ